MARLKFRIAEALVWLANQVVKHAGTPGVWPSYRAVDRLDEKLTGTKYGCAAYSYEGLKSFVEQDGPDGFGARATVKWLISDDGWRDLSDMSPKEIRRTFAMSGMDLDGDLEGEDD